MEERSKKLKSLLQQARNELDQTRLSYILVGESGRYFRFDGENYDFDETNDSDMNLWKVIFPDDEAIKNQGEFESLESAQENNYDFLMPIYNEIYPTDFQNYEEAQNAANRLFQNDCSLTLVEIADKYYMALLGAGMDMSWAIVEAYLAIGYYPPAYFHLPEFANTRLTIFNLKIIEALRRSQEFLQKRCESNALQTEKMFEWLE